MKTYIAPLLAGLIAMSSASLSLAAGPGRNGNGHPSARAWAQQSVVVGTLQAAEVETLLWMREEEKLARDVYRRFFTLWQDPVFTNIATAEQRHFDAMGRQITLFGVSDPALPFEGQFSNGELQTLYADLVMRGSTSLADAFKVGAAIEELDMHDLQAAIASSSNPQMTTSYSHLLEGSKNHLRAFVLRLEWMGLDYQPQYLDPVFYDAVIGR